MQEDEPEPVELPINGVLDLHTFRPQEIGELLGDYIEACREREIYSLRIIHGKGTGTLRTTVHTHLARRDDILGYRLAGEDAGGWGATLVELQR